MCGLLYVPAASVGIYRLGLLCFCCGVVDVDARCVCGAGGVCVGCRGCYPGVVVLLVRMWRWPRL